MAITKFKITKQPERATVKINGILVVLNFAYNIQEQENMTIDVSDRGVPYDSFKFKLGNENNQWSVEYTSIINVQVNTDTPEAISNIRAITNLEPVVVTTDFDFNDSTDRIKIVSIDPKFGLLLINNNEAIIGKTYMIWEFKNIIFSPTTSLDSQNVNTVITIQPGNKDEVGANVDIEFITTWNLSSSIQSDTEITGSLTT